MGEDTGSFIRYLIMFTAFMVVLTLVLLSYSTSGYTFTKYPGVDGDAIVCVEGEVNPGNQSLTIINDGDSPTKNPHVTVNGIRHIFNMTVSDKAVRQKTWAISLGCNNITFGADSDTRFKVKVEYESHWRPVIRYLEMGNLQVGHSVRYFISTEDSDTRPIVRSRLNITDITRDIGAAPIFDAEFNGTAVRYRMEEAGNYKADMQVYDGSTWSDVYEAGFSAHVITTEEQKKTYRIYELEDDPAAASPHWVPSAIRPHDNDAMKMTKRGVNGAYILYKRTSKFLWSLVAGL